MKNPPETVLLSERSEGKGPRAPEAELGKRNSGSGTREAELGKDSALQSRNSSAKNKK